MTTEQDRKFLQILKAQGASKEEAMQALTRVRVSTTSAAVAAPQVPQTPQPQAAPKMTRESAIAKLKELGVQEGTPQYEASIRNIEASIPKYQSTTLTQGEPREPGYFEKIGSAAKEAVDVRSRTVSEAQKQLERGEIAKSDFDKIATRNTMGSFVSAPAAAVGAALSPVVEPVVEEVIKPAVEATAPVLDVLSTPFKYVAEKVIKQEDIEGISQSLDDLEKRYNEDPVFKTRMDSNLQLAESGVGLLDLIGIAKLGKESIKIAAEEGLELASKLPAAATKVGETVTAGASALKTSAAKIAQLPKESVQGGASRLGAAFRELRTTNVEKSSSAAQKLATEILQPTKNDVQLAKLAGNQTSDGVKEFIKVAQVSKDFDEVGANIRKGIKEDFAARNALLGEDNFTPSPRDILKPLRDGILKAKSEKIATPSEIKSMEQVLKAESQWLKSNNPDRIASQARKETIYDEAAPLYKKIDAGTAIGDETGRIKAFELLGKGYKQVVENNDAAIRNINASYGGKKAALKMVASRAALAEKAITPSKVGQAVEGVMATLGQATGAGSAAFVARLAARQQAKLPSLLAKLIKLREAVEKGQTPAFIENQIRKITDDFSPRSGGSGTLAPKTKAVPRASTPKTK